MTSKIQTALRLALEAKRFTDLADIEVHRTRRGHWHPAAPCRPRAADRIPRARGPAVRALRALRAWPYSLSAARCR